MESQFLCSLWCSRQVRNLYINVSIDVLYQGIHLAIHFQKALVDMGVSLIDKKLVTSLKNFQLSVIKNEGISFHPTRGIDSLLSAFSTSTTYLNRLGHFLMDAFMVPLTRLNLGTPTKIFTTCIGRLKWRIGLIPCPWNIW